MSFTIDLLHDFTKFKNYLHFDQEIEEIAALAKDEAPYKPHLYFNRWEVCWITVKECIDRLLSWIFECFADFFACCGCTNCGRLFTVLSKQQMRDLRQLTAQQTYQTDFLVPSMNVHTFSSYNLYCTPSLKIDEIQDAKVKSFTYGRIAFEKGMPEVLHTLPFYFPLGLCRGKAVLFQYLYLTTRHLFSDPFNHFIAVGKQFEKGASEKAALMQNLDDSRLICGLLRQRIVQLFGYFKNQFQSPEAILRFKTLNPGFYSVNLQDHHVHYIKIDDATGFLWNPNAEIGGISVSGARQAEKLLKEFDKITKKPTDYVQLDLIELDDSAQIVA